MMALLLISFIMVEAAPALAGDGGLQWLRLRTPGDGAGGDWVIANNGGAGTEVNRIAVGADGNTIYALDSVTPLLFKSDDGGYGWLTSPVPYRLLPRLMTWLYRLMTRIFWW